MRAAFEFRLRAQGKVQVEGIYGGFMGLEFRGLRLGYNIGLRVRGRWFMASGSGFRVS